MNKEKERPLIEKIIVWIMFAIAIGIVHLIEKYT